jgi:putative cell wall-binding protein
MSRSVAATLFSCVLIAAGPAFGIEASLFPPQPVAPQTVRILLPAEPAVGPDGWNTLPVHAVLVPEGPGTLWYRIGSGPGPWRRYRAPVPIPEGKQALSAVLVAPDGSSGPVSEITVKSDFTVMPIAGVGASEAPSGPSLAPMMSSGTVSVVAQVLPAVGTEVRRLGGASRYDVATNVSSKAFASPEYVIIASGENFPDALTASGLAGCLDAPLLLVRRKTVPGQTSAEITRLGADKAIVCGGPATVSEGVLASLRGQGLQVERIGGATRYEVGANIAARINALTGGSRVAFVARGDIYPDALSLGPLAYRNKAPILLVRPTSMPPATRAALAAGRYGGAGIAGGTASVPPGIEAEIRRYTGSVTRWGGANRYDTAVAVASAGSAYKTNSWGYVGVAKGTVFSDALCGGVAAGKAGGVILLTATQPLTQVTADALAAHAGDVRTCDVFGGPVSVAPSTFDQIRAIFR